MTQIGLGLMRLGKNALRLVSAESSLCTQASHCSKDWQNNLFLKFADSSSSLSKSVDTVRMLFVAIF